MDHFKLLFIIVSMFTHMIMVTNKMIPFTFFSTYLARGLDLLYLLHIFGTTWVISKRLGKKQCTYLSMRSDTYFGMDYASKRDKTSSDRKFPYIHRLLVRCLTVISGWRRWSEILN